MTWNLLYFRVFRISLIKLKELQEFFMEKTGEGGREKEKEEEKERERERD